MKIKIVIIEGYNPDKLLAIYCPVCKENHYIPADGVPLKNGSKWSFNGDYEKPTISPSINLHACNNDGRIVYRCHFYIKNGYIEYCSDCSHNMKNKTIELPEI